MNFRKKSDLLIGISLSVAFLLWTWPWLYRDGFAEHDCYTMGAAIVQALRQGTGFHEPMLYFPVSQPLYYAMFFHWPGGVGMNLDRLIPVMNNLSWLAMGLSVGLLYGIARMVALPGWAIIGVVAIATSQTYFEMGTYGHPTSVALFLGLLGLIIWLKANIRPEWGWRQWAALGIFAACFACAFYIRIDVVFLLPIIFVMILATAAKKLRATGIAGVIVLLTLASYPLVIRAIFGQSSGNTGTGEMGLIQTLRAFLRPSILKGVFYYFYAAGAGACLMLGLIVLFITIRKRWITLAYGLVMVGLPMIYFLANPQPSRRFLPAMVASGVLVAMGGTQLKRFQKGWWYAGIAISVAAINLGSPLVVSGLVKATHKDISQTILARLMDTAYENHRVRQQYLWWDRERWKRLTSEMPEKSLVIGQWIDLAGMYLHTTGQGALVRTKMIKFDKAGHLFEVEIGKKCIYFLEWYAGAPATLVPEDHGPVYILAPLPAEELKKLPEGKRYVADTEVLRRRPF